MACQECSDISKKKKQYLENTLNVNVTFDIIRNRLASLPVDFDALRSLRELNLSHNKFVSISSMLVTLKHLKYLSLANNNLKFLPSHMSQLQVSFRSLFTCESAAMCLCP